jgi:signal transduction histidine kinase
VDVLATVLAATDATELFGALLFANAFLRRPADREYGLASLFCVAAFTHTSGSLATEVLAERAAGAALLASRLGALGLLAALPVAVHFALIYARGGRPTLRWLAPAYSAVAVFAVLEIFYGPRDGERATHAGAWAGRIARSVAPNGAATYLALFTAATVILVLVAHAYLVGQRGALAVVLGTTVLLAAVINDIGVASGAFSTVYLTDLGLAAFVIGIATTPGARYAAVTQELERRTEELRNRTRELRRSYEDLRNAQEELVKKEQLAVVGELAAVIAHEVRNPLAIIANAGAGLRKQAISREDHDTSWPSSTRRQAA